MPACKIPNCPVAIDGRCLEGNGAECPNLLPESPTPNQLEHEVETAPAHVEAERIFLPLPGGTPLEIKDARSFSRRDRAVVVALVGMRECGKTTLLARLHQLFLSSPLAGYDFAGSRTLPQLEELNWLATVESRAPQPMMPRTSSQFDNSFIHISVRPTVGGSRVDLLLNDISGETFNAAISSQSACDRLLALARADHVVTLVDGSALADSTLRNLQVSHVADFLQRVIQSGQCGRHTSLHLVVSKLDKLKGHKSASDSALATLTKRFEGDFGSIAKWEIAARPMDGSHPTVEPIGKLFGTWVQTTFRYPSPVIKTPPRHFWDRDFCRFGI